MSQVKMYSHIELLCMYLVSKKKSLIIHFNNKFDPLLLPFVDGCSHECNAGLCVGCCLSAGSGHLLDTRGTVLQHGGVRCQDLFQLLQIIWLQILFMWPSRFPLSCTHSALQMPLYWLWPANKNTYSNKVVQ